MVRFERSVLQTIEDLIPVSRLVEQYVPLKKRGSELIGLCPFHSEKTPSFTVSDEKAFYHCFGCGAHGNIFDFMMQIKGYSFPEAVHFLAEMSGVTLEKKDEIINLDKQYKLMKVASDWFMLQLHENVQALEYLKSRRLDSEDIDKFHMGYAPWGKLQDFLRKQGFQDTEMEELGLIRSGHQKKYEYFRERIIFPIWDGMGRVIAFSGRTLENNTQPKYINSPETLLFKKKQTVYGLHIARPYVKSRGEVIVVEGYVDVIGLHKIGICNTVCSMGTAIGLPFLEKLWSMKCTPILCLDGDEAGARSMIKVMETSLPEISESRNLKFAIMPHNLDPYDLAMTRGKIYFDSIIANSRNTSEVILHQVLQNTSGYGPERWAAVEGECKLHAFKIKNKSLKYHYMDFFRGEIYKLRKLEYGTHSKQNTETTSRTNRRTQESIKTLTGTNAAGVAHIDFNQNMLENYICQMIKLVIFMPSILDDNTIEEEFATVKIDDNVLISLRNAVIKAVKQSDFKGVMDLQSLELNDSTQQEIIEKFPHIFVASGATAEYEECLKAWEIISLRLKIELLKIKLSEMKLLESQEDLVTEIALDIGMLSAQLRSLVN